METANPRIILPTARRYYIPLGPVSAAGLGVGVGVVGAVGALHTSTALLNQAGFHFSILRWRQANPIFPTLPLSGRR
jgi:hypothetical protein